MARSRNSPPLPERPDGLEARLEIFARRRKTQSPEQLDQGAGHHRPDSSPQRTQSPFIGTVNDETKALPELQSAGFYRGQVTAEIYVPPVEACYSPPPQGLSPALKEYLSQRQLSLYLHQAEVFDAMKSGLDVVLATQTASGKSLAFNLPTFDVLLSSPNSTALFLYPTKALAHDQLEGLKGFEASLEKDFGVSVYDGDTPTKVRNKIKKESRLIISNPHALNLYLGWSKGWQRFLENLKVVVVDEAHYYTGSLGSHVAFMLRRLRRLCNSLGSDPQFLLASGTISNPKEHAEQLVGRPFTVFDRDASRRAGRWLVTWDITKDLDTSPQAQASLLVRHLVRCKRSVIVFSDSRAQAESIARGASDRANKVVAYRAGYSPEVRRSIESDLREGRTRGISSTSALEVGIDIGSLDTVVLANYPGSLASLLQRSGRAGRGEKDSVTVLMCGNDPVSRYFLHNPESILDRTPEAAVVNLSNRDILMDHLRCAAFEAPISLTDAETYFGKPAIGCIKELSENELLTSQDNGLYASAKALPHRSLSFIAGAGQDYVIHFVTNSRGKPHEERLSQGQALREAHPRAVFVHQGSPYRVTQINHDTRKITARPEAERAITVPQLFRAVTPTEIAATKSLKRLITLEIGEYRISEQIVGYKEYSAAEKGERKHKVTSPAFAFSSRGVSLRWATLEAVGVFLDDQDAFGAIHAAEHLLVKALPLLAIASQRDLSGSSIKNEGEPFIVLYERTPGGSGLSEHVYSRFNQLCRTALELVRSCNCTQGCPFCVLDSTCRDDDISKLGAISVLGALEDVPNVSGK